MIRVSLGGHLLAESNATVFVEGNHYFPPDSVRTKLFTKSDTTSVCPWKGTASYYNVELEGKTFRDIAWYYPTTISERAKPIEGYIAFYKDKVDVQTT